jgi:hypothetical protein
MLTCRTIPNFFVFVSGGFQLVVVPSCFFFERVYGGLWLYHPFFVLSGCMAACGCIILCILIGKMNVSLVQADHSM